MVPDDAERDHPGEEPAASSSPTEPVAPARATGDVTRILSQIEHGDGQAAEQLLPLVYEELRKLAAAKLPLEKPGQTLQATALVHEAHLRLVDVEKAQQRDSRGAFFRCSRGSDAGDDGQRLGQFADLRHSPPPPDSIAKLAAGVSRKNYSMSATPTV